MRQEGEAFFTSPPTKICPVSLIFFCCVGGGGFLEKGNPRGRRESYFVMGSRHEERSWLDGRLNKWRVFFIRGRCCFGVKNCPRLHVCLSF